MIRILLKPAPLSGKITLVSATPLKSMLRWPCLTARTIKVETHPLLGESIGRFSSLVRFHMMEGVIMGINLNRPKGHTEGLTLRFGGFTRITL